MTRQALYALPPAGLDLLAALAMGWRVRSGPDAVGTGWRWGLDKDYHPPRGWVEWCVPGERDLRWAPHADDLCVRQLAHRLRITERMIHHETGVEIWAIPSTLDGADHYGVYVTAVAPTLAMARTLAALEIAFRCGYIRGETWETE